MSNNSDNIIILNDAEGREVEFEFLDLIEYKNEEYVVLLPVDDDADQVVILKIEECDSEDEEAYVSVDDEATLMAVFEIFKEKFKVAVSCVFAFAVENFA